MTADECDCLACRKRRLRLVMDEAMDDMHRIARRVPTPDDSRWPAAVGVGLAVAVAVVGHWLIWWY